MPTEPLCFAHLTHLTLNATHVAWRDACALSACVPLLDTLELADNALHTLDATPPRAFQALRTLNLHGNRLAMDTVVGALHALPRLERLVLSDNAIETIRPTARFACLHTLSLQGNPVRDWASLEALETTMAAPYALHLDVPAALAADERAFRLEAIARLASLDSLQHTPITRDERQDAERYFVSHAPPDARDTPRFHALCAQHGAAPERAAAPTLRTKLVRVGLSRLDHVPAADEAAALLDAPHAPASLLRTLPLRMVRRRLHGADGAAASADAPLYALLRAASETLVVPLDDDAGTLEVYGVQDGDGLVLVSRGPA